MFLQTIMSPVTDQRLGRWKHLSAIACASIIVATGQAAGVGLDLAYWAPDRGTPYQWFEGAKAIKSFFKDDYRASGYVCLYVRNDGNTALRATDFQLNGRPLGELRKELAVIWWRLLPNPLPAGAMGEAMIRPREPLREAAAVRVGFADGSAVEARVTPTPRPIRIETVGFTESMDQVFLVVDRLDRGSHQLTRVWLDGQEVTARSRLLDPSFASGVSPVVVRPPRPLARGSYRTYRVETAAGDAVACCVRTHDGWVPLGSYGYATYEEYARNGCNGHNCFGRHGQRDLDLHALLGMRAAMILGDSKPLDYMIDHPGVFGYCPMDEPDCHDYGVRDIPVGKRIGYHAMEMLRRCQLYREADPQHASFLTIDLTYKPANYYVYGPIADVANPDCYPISLGADATMVREVVETARYGASPRPVTFTFQGCFEVPHDPKARAAKRFPRPPFAGEERLMLHYALGAGARGLFNYIHCSEKSKRFMSHGSREYPDVWHAIGRTYREVEHVAPLLARAHPIKLATADRDRIYVSTLLAGPDALLLVCVNEHYEQRANAFPYDPQTDVKLSVPVLPWLKPSAAWLVEEDGFKPLPLTEEDGRPQVALGRLDVAGIVLVAANPALVEPLEARYNARQQKIGNALLAAWRQKQAAKARQEDARRRITGEFPDCVVKGKGIGAYGIKNRAFWNPHNQAHWAFEFGRNDAAEDRDRGAEWKIVVSAKHAGQEHTIHAICGTWGRPAVFTLVAPDGKELLRRQISGRFDGALVTLNATFPVAGEYLLRFIQGGPGPKGGRITSSVYVIPADRNPPRALP